MNKLIEFFEHQVRSATTYTSRAEFENGVTIFVEGSGGTAEMEFFNDGKIIGLIQTDFIHTWSAFPNEAEMRSSAKKIKEMIE